MRPLRLSSHGTRASEDVAGALRCAAVGLSDALMIMAMESQPARTSSVRQPRGDPQRGGTCG